MSPPTLKPTSARPVAVGAFTFRCYRTGILRYSWHSDCRRLAAGSNHRNKSTYWASVDGAGIKSTGKRARWKRFRSLEAAMEAAVKVATREPKR